MSTLRALIWDVDGTLAETERDGHRVAFNRAFADEGLPWHWDVATYGELLKVTGGKERLRHWWRRIDPVAAEGSARVGARRERLEPRHIVHVGREHRGGELRIAQPAPDSEVGARPGLGNVQAAVGREALQQDVGEALRRGPAAGADVSQAASGLGLAASSFPAR